ncbi:putative 2-haloalkanoic acid dehalogenase [Aspergillus steynii IBT 23096]|uniref:Putative 2-haloalkanoic acid dehalogenase n=1 Tax=Aspergillus steynii IBT 23096 TaxID=1392250 RepID=A0A2I2FRE1_9EURO|nr:putative 2-haloalkanoic acid dehalogenase [Aspergillus steynii IBT 23096]PLB43205.1 putative 2-haloalkanoic acid dehalogenase [Aspergillus steynii IBT 23096]
MPSHHVVFDVVGTCFTFDAFFAAIESRLGPRLRAHNIQPQLFGYAWMEAAEREYAYLSMSHRYRPFLDIFGAIFYRTLWFSGMEDPRSFASDEDRDYLIKGYRQLLPREGVYRAMQSLRDAGFTVWCFTSGDVRRVRGYFLRSMIQMPEENIVSCDNSQLAKPALEAYQEVLSKFDEGDVVWFAAAHMWDVSAAKSAGFRGAYCTAWEKESCSEIFGEMDVTADSLHELAAQIIAASQNRG